MILVGRAVQLGLVIYTITQLVGLAVRSGDWKYHKKEIYRIKETKRESNGPSLYNLKSDIGESRNVLEEYPEIGKRLSEKLEEHIREISE